MSRQAKQEGEKKEMLEQMSVFFSQQPLHWCSVQNSNDSVHPLNLETAWIQQLQLMQNWTSVFSLQTYSVYSDTLKKKSFKHYSRRTLPEDRRSCLHRQANTSGGKSSATKLSFGGDFLEFHPEPQAWCKLKENQTNKYFRHSNENLYKGNLHL